MMKIRVFYQHIFWSHPPSMELSSAVYRANQSWQLSSKPSPPPPSHYTSPLSLDYFYFRQMGKKRWKEILWVAGRREKGREKYWGE